MLAKLGGVTDATVAAVKHRGKFHFVAPAELGGVIQGVPADSLTDCMNWSVSVLGDALEPAEKKRKK